MLSFLWGVEELVCGGGIRFLMPNDFAWELEGHASNKYIYIYIWPNGIIFHQPRFP